MEKRPIRVGITHGDVNGIGYEVILKAFETPEMAELCTPILYGSPKVATYHRKAANLETTFCIIKNATEAQPRRLNIISCVDEELKVDIGLPSAEAGKAAFDAMECAVSDYLNGLIDVIVTAPINKATIQSASFHFPGHTEYFESCLGDGSKALMILFNNDLRVALVTGHLPISQVADHINKESILEKVRIFNQSLKVDFNIEIPRIAILALNPHAGDNNMLGTEESTQITPAMQAAVKEGIQCFGPFPADGFFGSGQFTHFDGILAMYHDQGLAPFKALAMDEGVNFTAGLPIVRTSPAHGVAYNIAGKGFASADSFRHAIYAALDIYRNRLRHEEAIANPLRRLYFDKRDDSDKLRLDVEENEL